MEILARIIKMRNGEEMGSNNKYKPRYGSLGLWGTIDTKNSAEGPKCSQNETSQSQLQHKKILARIKQMRNDEEMGSKRQI
jgi:hypothetical protein